jgi:hypothetical protein
LVASQFASEMQAWQVRAVPAGNDEQVLVRLLQTFAPQAAFCVPVHCTQIPAAPEPSQTPSTVFPLTTWPQWLGPPSFMHG